MGTRHSQTVINKQGEVKIRQYGQWDGYPDGQGIDILAYLREGNLEKYQEEIEKINPPTESEINEINNTDNWQLKFPYLSSDCGSKLHKMIEQGEVKFKILETEEEMNKWCEGFYTIDFSKNEFISEFHGSFSVFSLDNLPSEEEYLESMTNKEDEE